MIRGQQQAGAVILGKTNTDEFAMGSSTEHSAYGTTRQPVGPGARAGRLQWRLGGGCGGLSRAAGHRHRHRRLDPAARGAHCGIVGIKPTYGRCSRWGIVAFASSLDQAGPIARDVRDAAMLLHRGLRDDPRDSTSATARAGLRDGPAATDDEAAASLQGLRLGVPREYFVHGHGARAWRRGCARPSPRWRPPAPRSWRWHLPVHTEYALAVVLSSSPRRRRRPTSPATTASATVTAFGAGRAITRELPRNPR